MIRGLVAPFPTTNRCLCMTNPMITPVTSFDRNIFTDFDSVITFQLPVAQAASPSFPPYPLAGSLLVLHNCRIERERPYQNIPQSRALQLPLHGHSLRVPGAHIIVTQNPLSPYCGVHLRTSLMLDHNVPPMP